VGGVLAEAGYTAQLERGAGTAVGKCGEDRGADIHRVTTRGAVTPRRWMRSAASWMSRVEPRQTLASVFGFVGAKPKGRGVLGLVKSGALMTSPP
jgi:hypothetical protein